MPNDKLPIVMRLRPLRRFRSVLSLLMAGLLTILLSEQAVSASASGDRIWQAFKSRYVRHDGRVIDSGNAEISHSESQGFGMLFAEYFGDRETFDRMRLWVEEGLRWNGTSLHAWKWTRDPRMPVPDPNNATDGDLLIGWALARAAQRWDEPGYAAAARRIAADVRSLLTTRDAAGRLVLLPAFQGFDHGAAVTLNLSYYVFPALRAFQRIDPSPVWEELIEEGLELVDVSAFGRWGLPPDWLAVPVDGTPRPAVKWPARFGFDAVRIPLYILWAGLDSNERLGRFAEFWLKQQQQGVPAWVGLEDDRQSPYRAGTGAQLVAALVLDQAGLPASVPAHATAIAEDYYSASLALMALIAKEETGPSASGRSR